MKRFPDLCLGPAARIAVRQARRAPWRSVLVVALVALPIGGLTAAAVGIRTAFATDQDRVRSTMGSADLLIDPPTRTKGRELLASLPSGSQVALRMERSGTSTVEGRQIEFALTELSPTPDRGPAEGLYHVVAGRVPTAPGEAAIDPVTLAALGGRIGGDLKIPVLDAMVHVTGTVVLPEYVSQPLALVGPGTLAANGLDTAPSYLVDLPANVSTAATAATLQRRYGASISTRDVVAASLPWGRTIATGIAFAAGAIALFGTGLIAAAAFSVGARQQLRTLGLVAAAGGEPRHLRRIVLLSGSVLGFAGSLVGVIVGILAVLPARGLLGRLANRIVQPVRVPILPLLGAVALGTLACTVAAYMPARAAAKLSTVEALAGRTRPPRPPGRIAAAGLVLVAIGAAILAWSAKARSDGGSAIGSIAMLSGFLVAIPLIVTWIGRVAGMMPTVLRIAARDLARHGRRTGAALAAATVALALPVGVGALTLSQDAYERDIPFMAKDQLSIGFFDGTSQPTSADRHAILADLRGAFPGAVVVPIRVATEPNGHRPYTAGPIVRLQHQTVRMNGTLIVGDADVLRALHAESGIAALHAGTVVAIGPDATDHGTVHVTTIGPPQVSLSPDALTLKAVDAGPSRWASLVDQYTYVISPQAAAKAGLSSEPNETFVLRASSDLTDADLEKAGAIVGRYSGASMYDVSSLGSQNGPGRWYFGIAGTLLALVIVGVIVALMGEESRRDRAIVSAVGAAPHTRRALAGASAWVVAAVAGALAIPAGFVPVTVLRIAQARGYPIVVPWVAMAVAVVGVPVVAAMVGAIMARQPKPMRLLSPIA
jgi:putative ABC transport system permease protein